MAYYAQGGPIPLFHRAEAINNCRRYYIRIGDTIDAAGLGTGSSQLMMMVTTTMTIDRA